MGDDAELYTDMQEPWFWDWVEGSNDDYEDDYELELVYDRYFFVDYENVNREGLNGISKLEETDCVRIYYSDAADTMTFGLHRRINASKAHFDYIKVQIPIKNAVDCQILFDIRDFAKQNRIAKYYIISKDSDFDQAVKSFASNKIKVQKAEEICKLTGKNAITPNTSVTKEKVSADKGGKEMQIRSFLNQNFKEKEFVDKKEKVVQLLSIATTRQQVNNYLHRIFSNYKVGAVYKKIRSLIKDLPGR